MTMTWTELVQRLRDATGTQVYVKSGDVTTPVTRVDRGYIGEAVAMRDAGDDERLSRLQLLDVLKNVEAAYGSGFTRDPAQARIDDHYHEIVDVRDAGGVVTIVVA